MSLPRAKPVLVLGCEQPEDLVTGSAGIGSGRSVLECHADDRLAVARSVELLQGALGEDDPPNIAGYR